MNILKTYIKATMALIVAITLMAMPAFAAGFEDELLDSGKISNLTRIYSEADSGYIVDAMKTREVVTWKRGIALTPERINPVLSADMPLFSLELNGFGTADEIKMAAWHVHAHEPIAEVCDVSLEQGANTVNELATSFDVGIGKYSCES